MHGIINLDFQDVTTVLKDGGVAIMSTGYGEGENRVTKAIEQAITSPLLNNNDIFNSKKVLLNINFCADKDQESLMMEEMNEINDFMSKFKQDVETKWGLATDSSLGGKVKITLLATGFGLQNVPGMADIMDQHASEIQSVDDEKMRERDSWIDILYGPEGGTSRRRKPQIFTFSENDLDNDVISMVETIPAFRRTKEELNKIKNKTMSSADTVVAG